MTDLYRKHFLDLVNVEYTGEPFVSMFIPLRYSEYPESKLFSNLKKAADFLLTKEGYPKVSLDRPDWSYWLNKGTITLAIFKGPDILTYIPLPVYLPPRVVVAKSFHVKPLLASSVFEQEALLIHFTEVGASVIRVQTGEEKLLEAYLPPRTNNRGAHLQDLSRSETIEFLEFLKSELSSHRQNKTSFLAISGTQEPIFHSLEFWKDFGLDVRIVSDSPRVIHPTRAISTVRLLLSEEINGTFGEVVKNVLSEEATLAPTLTELGKLLMQKQVSKLCVSLEDMHFGALDDTTGTAIEAETQTSTKDDDLLDDLIELAIKFDVQVSVVPKKFLPIGKSFVAS